MSAPTSLSPSSARRRGDGSYDKRLRRFTTPDILVIDGLGLRRLSLDEPIDLYEIVRRRSEKGSTIITSNRALEEWHLLFRHPLLASAAMAGSSSTLTSS